MLQEPIKFAVIGCGALALGQHIPNIAKSSKTVLHTCCDLSDEALKECKEVHGALNISKDWEATVKDPEVDAICLATTEKLRLPVIKLAAEYGKPMYVEKPLATNLEEVYAIQKVVNDSGIPFCVGHNRRCSPATFDAQRLFRQQMDKPEACLWRWDREGDDRPARDDNGVPSFSCRAIKLIAKFHKTVKNFPSHLCKFLVTIRKREKRTIRPHSLFYSTKFII